jgi:histidine triad (HIT) family protein
VVPRSTGDGLLRLWRPGETDHAAFAALAEELRHAQEQA